MRENDLAAVSAERMSSTGNGGEVVEVSKSSGLDRDVAADMRAAPGDRLNVPLANDGKPSGDEPPVAIKVLWCFLFHGDKWFTPWLILDEIRPDGSALYWPGCQKCGRVYWR